MTITVPAIRRIVNLHRIAMGRWLVSRDRRAAAIPLRGPMNHAAYYTAAAHMDRMDAVMSRLQDRLASL